MSAHRVLFVDASEGLAGDMFVAAMLDLGVELQSIRDRLEGLGLDGYGIECSQVQRGAFRAIHFKVEPTGAVQEGSGHHQAHLHAHAEPEFPGHPHRSWADIRALLEDSRPGLGDGIVDRAIAVFQCLAKAEGRVHGVETEAVHFHEVGAVDSIVDIVSAAIAIEILGVEEIICSPLPISSGQVRTAHGPVSLPAPATLEILADWPVRTGRHGLEQVTPTGAAIVVALARPGQFPEMVLKGTGVGGGTANPEGWANIVRLSLGEASGTIESPGQVEILSAHMDDLMGEHLPGLLQALLDAGALDAFATPVIMKKGRSGLWVQALASPARSDAVAEALLAHGSSFGLRRSPASREVLDRWHEQVSTPFGEIRIKIGARRGQVLQASPEFEDVRAAAESCKVPIPRVHQAALAAWNSRDPELR
jgi:uncharacterized protein (TIGR00299 family) protein